MRVRLGNLLRIGRLDRVVSIMLMIAIIAIIGVFIYVVDLPKADEKYTEFYLLGYQGTAVGYPKDFLMAGGKMVSIRYDNGQSQIGGTGNLIIGIINHEQVVTTYEVTLLINSQPVPIEVDGVTVDSLGPITLRQDEKFEQEIGLTPFQAGENQKVDFVLLVGGKPYFDSPPHIWINTTITP